MSFIDLSLLATQAIIFYAWVLFPLILLGLSAVRRPRPLPAASATPAVTLILSAYNEESVIAARVANLLAMDYPGGRWRAWIGVDGARDGTAAAARSAAAGHPAIHVFDFPENRGKMAVLKDLAARAGAEGAPGEALVFTDANTEFEPQALRRLVEPFADPAVGGVCGKLVFLQKKTGRTDEGIYWTVENWLKARESDLDSCLGANGAIYAIRPVLFWKAIPANTIIDDFVIGMKVREQGYRIVYQPLAVASEDLPERVADEWKRRVRIGAGDFQALRLCAPCLSPRYGVFAWCFWSHKVLRWFTPHLMLAGIVLAFAAIGFGSRALGFATLALYAAVAALSTVIRGVRYLLVMQAAIFMGFVRFCRGNLEGRWQRTGR